MTQTTLENLTGCVLANFVALTYNEKIKHTPYYKHNLKRLINPLIKELVVLEEREFDAICSSNEEETLSLTDSCLEFLELITKSSFKDFLSIHNLVIANDIDGKRIQGLADKIIREKQ